MFIYNLITELFATQVFMIVLVTCLCSLLVMLLTKTKITLKWILTIIFGGMMLSLFSGLMGTGNYGGTLYHEHFGWPYQYFNLSRNMFADTLGSTSVPMPFDFNFNIFKFLLNTSYYSSLILSLLLLVNIQDKNVLKYLGTIFLFLLSILFVLSNNLQIEFLKIPSVTDEEISEKLDIVEREYPEFKDYESQKTFAGSSVEYEKVGETYYIGYILYGSGLPIVQATCFEVNGNTVSKVGEFPNPLDSYAGYPRIDVKTCKGIKAEGL